MSRSYKKFPYVREHESCKYGKKQANRKVRNYNKNLSNQHPSNKMYRKLYETWDISDCNMYYPLSEYMKDAESGESYQTLVDWKKSFYYK